MNINFWINGYYFVSYRCGGWNVWMSESLGFIRVSRCIFSWFVI